MTAFAVRLAFRNSSSVGWQPTSDFLVNAWALIQCADEGIVLLCDWQRAGLRDAA
jgi:hypothetical protein